MTALELKLTKTTLRNYFGKYWHNVKYNYYDSDQ